MCCENLGADGSRLVVQGVLHGAIVRNIESISFMAFFMETALRRLFEKAAGGDLHNPRFYITNNLVCVAKWYFARPLIQRLESLG